jgi:hypothetical protein
MQQADGTRPLIRQPDRRAVRDIDSEDLPATRGDQSIHSGHQIGRSAGHLCHSIPVHLLGTPPVLFSKNLPHAGEMMRPETFQHVIAITVDVDTIDPTNEIDPQTGNPVQQV